MFKTQCHPFSAHGLGVTDWLRTGFAGFELSQGLEYPGMDRWDVAQKNRQKCRQQDDSNSRHWDGYNEDDRIILMWVKMEDLGDHRWKCLV